MADPTVLSYHDSLLRQSDLCLLDPPYWLNDRIISFAYQYYEMDLFKNNPNFAFISPDVCQFIKLSPQEELDIFLSPLNLQEKDVIFMPVNDNESANKAGGAHWSLLTYYKKKKSFSHYDSSGCHNESSARLMVKNLSKHLKIDAEFVSTNCPQQTNSYDCGLYALCVTEHIAKTYQGNRAGPLSDVVTAASVSRKRSELKKLIRDLGKV